MNILDFQQSLEPGPDSTETFEGVIAENAVAGVPVRVIIPVFDGQLAHGPCPWTPVVRADGIYYPHEGDAAIVVEPVNGEPWIAGWTPTATSPDVAISGLSRTPTWVNVLDHGVKGTGRDNDTVKLQEVIDGSPASVIYVPKAARCLTGQLRLRESNQTWVIEGELVQATTTGSLLVVEADDVTITGGGTLDSSNQSGGRWATVIVNYDTHNVVVRGMRIPSPGGFGLYAIGYQSVPGALITKPSTNLTFDSNIILNAGRHAIYLSRNVNQSRVTNNFVDGSLAGANGIMVAEASNFTLVEGNVVLDVSRNAIELWSDGWWDVDDHSQGKIRGVGGLVRGNRIVNPLGMGVSLSGYTEAIVGGNQIVDSGNYGIELTKSDGSVCTGNTITRPVNNGIGIHGSEGHDGYVVTSNTIVDPVKNGIRAALGEYAETQADGTLLADNQIVNVQSGFAGIELEIGTEMVVIKDFTISDNTIKCNAGVGINVRGSGHLVSGNRVRFRKEPGHSSSGYGIWLRGSSEDCVVNGNFVDGTRYEKSILCEGKHIVLSSNTGLGASEHSLLLAAASDDCFVESHMGKVASGLVFEDDSSSNTVIVTYSL